MITKVNEQSKVQISTKANIDEYPCTIVIAHNSNIMYEDCIYSLLTIWSLIHVSHVINSHVLIVHIAVTELCHHCIICNDMWLFARCEY